MTQPANQASTAPHAAHLAARLLFLTRQEQEIKREKDSVKEELEGMYANNMIAAKPGDIESLFSDGTTRKIRLMRVATGTYFKVADEYKDEYKAESEKLNTKYLKSGRAAMAEKAPTWKAQEVKD